MSPRAEYAVSDEAIALRRRGIAAAAAEVFGQAGLKGLSLSAVAKRAGVSVGQLQHHFGTRQALLLAAVELRVDEIGAEWSQLSSTAGSPLARLRSLLSFAVEGERDFAAGWGFWLELAAAGRHDPQMRAYVNEALETWRRLFVEVLDEASAAGLLPAQRTPDVQAARIVAMVDGFALQVANGTYGLGAADMEQMLRDAVADLLGLEAL